MTDPIKTALEALREITEARSRIGLHNQKNLDAAIVALEGLEKAEPVLTESQKRMLHDFPALSEFFTKHRLGPMMAPSCLCCGQQTDPVNRPVAVQNMELPGMVVCKQCKTAASTVATHPAPVQAEPAAQVVGLTDDDIWKFWWGRPMVPEGEDDSMEAEFVPACRAAIAEFCRVNGIKPPEKGGAV